MPLVHKVCFEKMSGIKKDIECAWNIIEVQVMPTDIVYGSYLENSVNLKEFIEHHYKTLIMHKFAHTKI